MSDNGMFTFQLDGLRAKFAKGIVKRYSKVDMIKYWLIFTVW